MVPWDAGSGGPARVLASTDVQELVDGLWRWTDRHEEWHPGEWGSQVACFALDAGDTTLLIDPVAAG